MGPAVGPWAQVCGSGNAYRVTTMSIWTSLRGRAARWRGRTAAGAGTVEYVAAIAIAAIIIGAVVLGVNNAKVEVYSARVLCLIQSVVGSGQCDEAIGDGPGSGYGPDDVNEPWYCEVFGIGCSDQPTTDPDDVDIPDGLDRNDPIVQMMLSTERGRQVLQWLSDNDIPIVIDPGATGAYWNQSEIVLGPGYDNAAVLVHEANHARYTVEGRHADVSNPDRDAYVHGAVDEEVDGTVQQILSAQEFRNGGAQLGSQPGEPEYNAAYQQAIRNGESQAQAQQAGYQAVSDLFYHGGMVTSTNGQAYPDYYGSYWDSEH
ncbi:hypothetical protein GCM10022204_27380 [Microlunatus aurantiacus]|uniref:Uncharacterized protein n=2 Tax=Microlunatus aurantiacus TaxID=446786 RepID=A0ABP7DMZ2_9ACTN